MNTTGFRPRRARAIARKELAHIFRDRFTLGLALGLPVAVVFIFGFAIEFNQTRIPTAILDQDRTQSSRQLVETFTASGYFSTSPILDASDAEKELESERSSTVLVIPPGMERDLLAANGAEVQVLVNAADNQAAGSVLSYVGELRSRASGRLLGTQVPAPNSSVMSRFLYNPELNSRWFTVPGLMVIIMTMIAILLTALTVAREWEFGSMELLLSTPVHPMEIILGKMAPYAALCLTAVGIVYASARLIFDVPFRGNIAVYLMGCVLFLITYLAQGLMISVLTRKQMLAMQVSMISGLLPSQLLSGFIFPVENMPSFFQTMTMILPARWFMEISRRSFLQGATLWEMRGPFLALTALMCLFVLVALKKFKKDLEP